MRPDMKTKWRKTLFKDLKGIIKNHKVVLLGIGNPDRGDDGLGPALANKLMSLKSITSINCEDVPENFTDVIRAADPEVILLVDAIDFGGNAGEVILARADDLQWQERFDTHHASLIMVRDYLAQTTGAQIWLLGIQPKSIQFGESLSPEIHQVVDQLAVIFRKIADKE